MKKDLKNLGQLLYRKELKNEELKNSIGGKGYTCGGAFCYVACVTLSGNKRCAVARLIPNQANKYFDSSWGCSGGSATAPCWCYTNGGADHLCA